jgi:ubiquinol-cytochrome c reductase cytochrome c subunit
MTIIHQERHAMRADANLCARISGLVSVIALTCAATFGAASALAQSAEKGRETFMTKGCWQCHGTVGQGGIHGLKLAPDPKPLAYYEAFVRNSMGPMPPYSERVLSKGDMADIHAYLRSIPKGADYRTIPLLNP